VEAWAEERKRREIHDWNIARHIGAWQLASVCNPAPTPQQLLPLPTDAATTTIEPPKSKSDVSRYFRELEGKIDDTAKKRKSIDG
jgi:hypothetical protein